MPAVTHAGPDPNANALGQDLMAEAPVDCAILFGSRALGGWDDQSDLDIIVIHQTADDNSQERSVVGLAVKRLRQLHYPGYLAYESPHHEVIHGLMLETPDNYRAHRRTQNHVMARAAREGLVLSQPWNQKGKGGEVWFGHHWVLNLQWMVAPAALRSLTRACTSRRSASSPGSRCFKQERDSTLNSISAMFNQLPCLGV